EVVRLPLAIGPPPLEKSVGGNEAAALPERVAERWQLVGRLRAGVDEGIALAGVLRPRRHQSPPQALPRAPAFGVGPHGSDVLGGRNVAALDDDGFVRQVEQRGQGYRWCP